MPLIPIDQPSTGRLVPVESQGALSASVDIAQQMIGEGLQVLGDPGGFGSWLADQSADLAGYTPEYSGDVFESPNKLGWIKERGLENAAMTALPYLGFAASGVVASIPQIPAAVKGPLITAINSGTGFTMFTANTGDVAADYKERLGKDTLETTDKAAIAAISTVVTGVDYLGPVRLKGQLVGKQELKKALVDLAIKDPKTFTDAAKTIGKEGFKPFLQAVGYEMGTEGIQKGISMMGADIAKGELRSGVEYAREMTQESLASLFGATSGVSVQTIAPTPTPEQEVEQAKELQKNAPLPHEKGLIPQTLDAVADNTARKAVSILNPYSELAGEGSAAQQIREKMEHFEKFEGPYGVAKPADWQEIKQTQVGDLYNPIERAMSRARKFMLGRKIAEKDEQQLYDYITANKGLKAADTKAVQAALAGDMRQLDNLKGEKRRQSDLVYAGEVIKNNLGEARTRMEDLGIKMGFSEVGGNMPLFFDTKQIKKNRSAFETYLKQNKYVDNQPQAKEVVDNIISNGGVPYLTEPQRKRSRITGVVNKPFNPKTIPSKYLSKKVDGTLNNYLLKAAGRIAYSQQFGPNGEILNDLVDQMITETNALDHTVNDGDIKRIYDISDAMLGRYNPVRQEGMDVALKTVAALETISTLGGATLSSIQEPFVAMERLGVTNFIKSIPGLLDHMGRGAFKSIHKNIVDSGDAAAIAEDLGVALDKANMEVLTSTFSAEASKIQEYFFRSPFGMFLHQWTRSVRIMAAYAGVKMLDNYRGKFLAGKETSTMKQELFDLGIDPKDFIAISKALTGAKMTIEDLLTLNAKNPNQVSERLMDMTLPSGKTIRTTVRPALARIVNEIVMAPRATNRPLWLSNRWLSPLGQLKSFPITFGNTVMKRIINKLNPKKNPNIRPCDIGNTFGAMAAAVAAAYGMIWVKDLIRGNDPEDRPSLNYVETPSEFNKSQLGRAIDGAGLYGVFSLPMGAMDSKNPLSSLFGPTFSDIEELYKQTVQLANSEISLGDFMYYLTDRTMKLGGAIGLNKDRREAAAEWVYNQVEN